MRKQQRKPPELPGAICVQQDKPRRGWAQPEKYRHAKYVKCVNL